MDDFGLNDSHQELLNQYMQFARYERSDNIKSVQQLFQDVIETRRQHLFCNVKDVASLEALLVVCFQVILRLLEATYTADEVRKLLHTLCEVVSGEVETELMLFAHNNILLLQQLCTQAEKWHLRLTADLSELHNQDLLVKVKNWEEDFRKFGANRKPERLEPMISEAQEATFLLRQQLESLQKENQGLRTNIASLQSKIQETQEQHHQLVQNLSVCQKELERNKELIKEEKEKDESTQWQEVETKFSELTSSLQESTVSRAEAEEQLNATKEQLKQVQSQLQLAQLELERKFSETVAYTNMKKMIAKKNDQMKDLRKRLQKYQGDVDDVEGDDEANKEAAQEE